MSTHLAPCVAVVGPANSGKTTLVHLLDRALQQHREEPLAYIVKGTPDGTGRYLLYSPDLRDALKEHVKGKWIPETVATVCSWIASCRAHLDLVLLDFGGRHGKGDDYMLQHCSHYLVLARQFEDPQQEADEGMASWTRVCEENGLRPVAHLRSLWRDGVAAVQPAATGVLEGTFRGDAGGPEDATNGAVIEELVNRLLSLRVGRATPSFLSLKMPRRWEADDLADLGGRAAALERIVADHGGVVLGGVAPLWAYCAAMHRALDRAPGARIHVFDPKVVTGLVEVPPALEPNPRSPLARALAVTWDGPPEGVGGVALRLQLVTEDRMLPPMAFQYLANVPTPPEPIPYGQLYVSGAAPIWLHLTYSRWLRSSAGGRPIGIWDAGTKAVYFVTGFETPRVEPYTGP